jgi:uncharacterized membrane protein
MRVDPATLTAILAMAAATLATRLAGLWLARVLRPGPAATAALDAMPVAVLTAVIAPSLVKDGAADLLAAAITVLAAARLPLLAVVAVGVAAAVLLRRFAG